MKRHKIQGKGRKDLSRGTGTEGVAKRILIVTEGSKTEVNYLKNLRAELRARTADVEVTGDSDPSPDKVYEFALTTLAKDSDFDYVYLVIDKDRHTTYSSTIKQATSKKIRGSKAKFKIISSVPCFELWLLLHIKMTAKPYGSSNAGGSPAKELIKDLKEADPCFAKYEKSNCDYYGSISSKRGTAITNAKALLKESNDNGQEAHHENPSTRMHELIEDMHKLVTGTLG